MSFIVVKKKRHEEKNDSLICSGNMQKKYEEESHAKAVAQDNLIAADRKANANQNALEEVRTLLEQADRNREYPKL